MFATVEAATSGRPVDIPTPEMLSCTTIRFGLHIAHALQALSRPLPLCLQEVLLKKDTEQLKRYRHSQDDSFRERSRRATP